MINNPVIWRASILHFLDDPGKFPAEQALEYFNDGALVVHDGHIIGVGPFDKVANSLAYDYEVHHCPGKLLVPGFIDTHVHYPQLGITGACGNQLIEWLNHYAFPAESAFHDAAFARTMANFFLEQTLAHGTTTALVFGTVHPESVTAFFQACEEKNLRMIAGKVMMDRNAPATLLDTPESSYRDSRDLIRRWHCKGRLAYAVTPRFAPTSSPEQLIMARRLLGEYEGLYLQTHLAENVKEVDWVRSLYPNNSSYLDVYDQFGLLGERSVFAHSIHLEKNDWKRLAESESKLAFCPGSNLFIGSGLFDFEKASALGIDVGLGSDIGGGTSLCLLASMRDAYQVGQLQNSTLSPFRAFYLATLGGAKALGLADKIGNFQSGSEADFLVLDPHATPLLKFLMSRTKTLKEKLGTMMVVGDDRLIEKTVIMGKAAWSRDAAEAVVQPKIATPL